MKVWVLVGGALALVATLVVLAAGKSYFFDERNAESELRDYLGTMYADKTVLGQDCVGRDTDGDGYVSCTARVKGKDGPEETLALECAAGFMNSGCKARIGLLPTTATK
ncbi:hypothetical protein HY634_00380 [Candidatus Uhrbacteria bacterium]|nr:hypothetical protein [Candidatus Uhrbacteria bacterium]